MSQSLVSATDLTGKARLRHSALHLFATKGFARTSLRRISQRAGVSLALIGHHFGSKAALRIAVDQWVMQTLQKAIVPAAMVGRPLAEVEFRLKRELGAVLAAEPDLRSYLRRAILEDSGRGEPGILGMFLHGVRQVLGMAQGPFTEQELQWGQSQVFLQVLGLVVMEPILRGYVPEPASPPNPAGPLRETNARATNVSPAKTDISLLRSAEGAERAGAARRFA